MPRASCGLFALLAIPWTLGLAATSYSLQTLAGSDFAGDGGPASAALLNRLQGVAVDAKGNIYIADADDHRVRKISSSGIISTVAGNGHPGAAGDGGPASSAQLRTPYGVAVDNAGNIYIADLGNACIRRITTDGLIATFAGGGTAVAAAAASQAATGVALTSPRNVTTDTAGNLYFSDFGGNRVYRVSVSGTLTVLAGTGQAGYSGDGGPASSAQLDAPAGLAVDALGTVYISDTGNARVRKVYRGLISTLGDGGVPGSPPSVPVTLPVGLALDAAGNLYIADPGGNQTLRVSSALAFTPIAQPALDVAVDPQSNLYACWGAFLYLRPRQGGSTIIAGGSPANYLGDGGSPLQARFSQPAAVARDADGNLYIADTGHHRIRKLAADGIVSTVAGNGAQGFAGDGAAAVSAELNGPLGLALDTFGNIYIADTGNHRIRKVDASGFISTIAGTGTAGHSADGTLAAYAQLHTPTWLALHQDGSLYFSETGAHVVRKITAVGRIQTVAGIGVPSYTGDGVAATSSGLNAPQGIAIDASGNLYIADTGNRRIRKVSAPVADGSMLITTVPDVHAATWLSVRGLAVGAEGSVYLTDAGAGQVFRIDPSGTVLTIAGTGVQSFTDESGAALQEGLDTPSGLVVDAKGNVYLSDAGNGRIRMLTPASGSVIAPTGSAQSGVAVASAASLSAGAVAPGELVSIFGSGLGPAEVVTAQQATTELGGTQVTFNGRLAPLSWAGPNQINLQVPYSLGEVRPCVVQVVAGGIVRARTAVEVADSAPGVFTMAGGTGQAAALNQDGSLNSADNPADRGSVIVLFATGEGQTTPASVEGRIAGTPAPVPVLGVSVKIGIYDAEILYAGAAPGFAGLLQVNARVPGGFAPPGILPVTVQVGTAVSQTGVTIAAK